MKIEDLYFNMQEHNNIIYTCDMLRLKTYIDVDKWRKLEFRLETFYKDKIFYWVGQKKQDFHYNYKVDVAEGSKIYIAFHHNNEKIEDNHNLYNLTIEFNPNKVKTNILLFYILDLSADWYIKSYDLAFDLKINILDLIHDLSGRHTEKIFSNGFDDKTIYLGEGNCRIKIYNKKRESNLDIMSDLTRIEISRQLEDFPIKNIKIFQYDNNFPILYTNNHIFTFSDYNDKTLLVHLYAAQNGYPLRDMSKTYRKKIKELLEGGDSIKFDNRTATQTIKQIIYKYFVRIGAKQIIF